MSLKRFEAILLELVSIPSNGSIQFLLGDGYLLIADPDMIMSQSPQTGQFNSYSTSGKSILSGHLSLNPLKRVNSILTWKMVGFRLREVMEGLNPLKRVNSILTTDTTLFKSIAIGKVSIPSNGSIQFLQTQEVYSWDPNKKVCLNPLKRVNSILTSICRICSSYLGYCLNPLKRVNSILT